MRRIRPSWCGLSDQEPGFERPMIGDTPRDAAEENDHLESDLVSPSLARMTKYAIARQSGDPMLRRMGGKELTADT